MSATSRSGDRLSRRSVTGRARRPRSRSPRSRCRCTAAGPGGSRRDSGSAGRRCSGPGPRGSAEQLGFRRASTWLAPIARRLVQAVQRVRRSWRQHLAGEVPQRLVERALVQRRRTAPGRSRVGPVLRQRQVHPAVRWPSSRAVEVGADQLGRPSASDAAGTGPAAAGRGGLVPPLGRHGHDRSKKRLSSSSVNCQASPWLAT